MKAVIFDMDGLLIDSERLIHEALIYAGDVMGISGMHETALSMLGANQQKARDICLKKYGADFDYDRLCDLKHKYFYEKLPDLYSPAKEGVPEAVDRLKNAGFRLAVASSSRRGWVEPSLKYIGIYDQFEAVICGDMVTESKPSPQIFLRAAETLSEAPNECYVLEDSYNGIRAAAAADMKPIMVPDLLPPDDDMKKLSVYIAENITNAAEYIISKQNQ